MENLHLFKQASFAVSHHCLESDVFHMMKYLKFGVESLSKQQLSKEKILDEDSNHLHELFSNNITIQAKKSSE